MRTRDRGFTLIEILIVVLVIAILLALLLPALSHLRRKGRIAATNQLIQQVTSGLTTYLERYPMLGDQPDSSDFKAAPWKFLYTNWKKDLKEEPPITLQLKLLAVGSGSYQRAPSVMEGEKILDYFPNGVNSNLLEFEIWNEPVPGFTNRLATKEIRIRSRAGTVADTTDDVVWEYIGGKMASPPADEAGMTSLPVGEWFTKQKGR